MHSNTSLRGSVQPGVLNFRLEVHFLLMLLLGNFFVKTKIPSGWNLAPCHDTIGDRWHCEVQRNVLFSRWFDWHDITVDLLRYRPLNRRQAKIYFSHINRAVSRRDTAATWVGVVNDETPRRLEFVKEGALKIQDRKMPDQIHNFIRQMTAQIKLVKTNK